MKSRSLGETSGVFDGIIGPYMLLWIVKRRMVTVSVLAVYIVPKGEPRAPSMNSTKPSSAPAPTVPMTGQLVMRSRP
eukprot:2889028-Rhodomonas_salina.5